MDRAFGSINNGNPFRFKYSDCKKPDARVVFSACHISLTNAVCCCRLLDNILIYAVRASLKKRFAHTLRRFIFRYLLKSDYLHYRSLADFARGFIHYSHLHSYSRNDYCILRFARTYISEKSTRRYVWIRRSYLSYLLFAITPH